MPRILPALCLGLLWTLPAAANDFAQVRDQSDFLAIVEGRELRHSLGIRLSVRTDGRILGSALGWQVTGSWKWQDGYFCREMDWSGYAIPFNCQMVEVREGREIRFTVDRGAGESASFRLR